MFREMLRKKQQLSQKDCIDLLIREPRGVLSVLGDDDYPYGIPMNHWYCPQDGHIYFHGAKAGHKLDAIARHDKVSFCVYDRGYRKEGEWSLNINSVIVFGRIRKIDDPKRVVDICRNLSLKYTLDREYIESEIEKFSAQTLCLELIPEHISGKTVNES